MVDRCFVKQKARPGWKNRGLNVYCEQFNIILIQWNIISNHISVIQKALQ